MNLCDFVCAEAIRPNLLADSRDAAISELVQSLADSKCIKQEEVETITQAIIAREEQGSTGIGKGIAVPHIKHAGVDRIYGTIGCSKDGIDFASLDKAPVYSVLLLISPSNQPDQHLEAMESLFAHLQQDMFRKFLRQARTTEAVVDLLKEADESHSSGNI